MRGLPGPQLKNPPQTTRSKEKRFMSKFTFKVVNNRGDETQLNLMLTATSNSGLGGIQLGKSTLVKDFFTGNPSHSFSAETLVGSRLYVGYGSMPPAPDPNSNQYYGWVEFSRNNVDKGVWLNLSNVDIVGLPLTLKGNLADDGKPFSFGVQEAGDGYHLRDEDSRPDKTRPSGGEGLWRRQNQDRRPKHPVSVLPRIRRLSEHIDDGGRQIDDSNRYAERRNVQDVHRKLFQGQVPAMWERSPRMSI
jgi:hypothetical protein